MITHFDTIIPAAFLEPSVAQKDPRASAYQQDSKLDHAFRDAAATPRVWCPPDIRNRFNALYQTLLFFHLQEQCLLLLCIQPLERNLQS